MFGLFFTKFDDTKIVSLLNDINIGVCKIGCKFSKDPTAIVSSSATEFCSSGDPVLTVTTLGYFFGQRTYQWQQQVDGGWENIDGATSKSYTAPLSGIGDYEFRVVVTFCSGKIIFSNIITISIVESGMVIYDTPFQQEICSGGIGRMLVEVVSGGTGPYTAQLQQYVGGDCVYPDPCFGGFWVDLPGIAGTGSASELAAMTFNTAVLNDVGIDYFYRFKVTDSLGCVSYSGQFDQEGETIYQVTYIAVLEDPVITAYAENYTVCEGGLISLHGEQIGGAGDVSWQWQIFNESEEWVNAPGLSTNADYTISSLSIGGHNFRLLVTQSGSGCTAISESFDVVVVSPDLVLATGVTIMCSELDLIHASVSGEEEGYPGYEWELEVSEGVWSVISTEAVLEKDQSELGPGPWNIRAKVYQDSGCVSISNTLTFQLLDPISVVLSVNDESLCTSTQLQMTALVSGAPDGEIVTYSYEVDQYQSSGFEAFTGGNYILADTFSISTNNIKLGIGTHNIRVISRIGTCSATSNVITITISNC